MQGDTIRIDFQVGALAEVQRALQTVEKALVRLDSVATKSAGRSMSERTRTVKGELSQQVREQEKAARDAERIARNAARVAQTLAKERTKQEAIEAKERTKIAEREERDKAKAAARYLTEARQARERLERRSANEARNGDRVRDRVGGAAGRLISNAVGTTTKLAGVALGLGGGFTIADALGSDIRLRGKARELSIQSEGSVSAEQVYGMATRGGVQYGRSSEEMVGGLDRFYAKAGDMNMAVKMMGELAELANATGASFNDLSEVAGQFFASDKTMSAEQLAQAMRDIAEQGRLASVDMRELAQYGSRLTGAAALFAPGANGNRLDTVRKLGGLTQIAAAKGGASSAAEATESVLAMGLDINEHADRFKELGINFADKNGQLNDPLSIIRQAVDKTNGNSGALMELFGRRSFRAAAGYATVFNDARRGGASKADALAAADKQVNEYAAATMTREQAARESAQRNAEVDRQLEMAMTELHNAVGKELTPEIVKLVPKLRELIPLFGKAVHQLGRFIGWFAENPLQGLGAIVAAAVVKDLALAGIGAAVKSAIVAALGAAGFGNAAGGAAGGVASGAAGAGAGVGAGALGTALAAGVGGAAGAVVGGVNLYNTLSEQEQALQGAHGVVGKSAFLGAMTRRINEGTATPEDIARAKAISEGLSTDIASAKAAGGDSKVTQYTSAMASVLTGNMFGSRDRSNAASAGAVTLMNGETEATVKRFNDALANAANKLAAFSSADPARNSPMTDPRRGGTSK